MTQPRQIESNANSALAAILSGMMHGCEAHAERTRTIAGNNMLHPDILITAPDRAPVVIEAEFMPAYSAEQEALDGLGFEVEDGRQIEVAIALRLSKDTNDLGDEGQNSRPMR